MLTGNSQISYDFHYYFAGIQLGDINTDGPSDTDYVTALAQRGKPLGNLFHNVGNTAKPTADFDQSYDPIDPADPGDTASSYTARSGDSLQSIALAVWGDASLWYMLADANGLDGGASLVAGQILIVPDKITNIHNSASTYRVYDPNAAAGNTNPLTPTPAPQHHHGNHCGVFGQILLVAVAVAVVAVLHLPPVTSFATAAEAAGGGALASIASQGVGLATGIQDKFSFSGVALAAIGGGVGGAFGKGFGDIAGSQFLGHVATGVVSDVLTQGLALATGLQDNFSWGEVASAGLAAGVGKTTAPSFGETLARNTAGAIAGAAGRSLLTGTDFGDNILKALPSAIGQTIGNFAAGQIAGQGAPNAGTTASSSSDWGNGDTFSLANGLTLGSLPSLESYAPSAGAAPQLAYADVGLDAGLTFGEQSGAAILDSADAATVQAQAAGKDYINPVIRSFGSQEELDAGRSALVAYNAEYHAKIGLDYADFAQSMTNYAYAEQQLQANTALADRDTNELLFAGIGAPVLIAGSAVLAPAAGAYVAGLSVSGTTGGLAYYGTSFLVGGASGGAFEYSKNSVFGLQGTVGGYVGSVLGGGVGATGLQILGRGAPVVLNNIALGGAAGGGADAIGQVTDIGLGNRNSFDTQSILISTGIGAAAGGASSLEVNIPGLNAGRNNSVSIYNGLQTRFNNGNIGQFQLRYGMMAGVGQGVLGVGQGAASSVYVGIYQDAHR